MIMDNYEQKYKKALEAVKFLQEVNPSDEGIHNWVKDNFPELKESEDERMWKLIKKYAHYNISDVVLDADHITREYLESWLEKQGKHKPYGQRKECEDCQFNYAGECKGYCQMKRDEQKPMDNVEPEFHEGDWVVYDHRPYQVVELPKEGYINLGLRRNGKVEFAPSPYCRHWTIQDARDGDILVASDGSIFLFAGVDDCACKYYVALTTDNHVEINKDSKGGYWETSRAVYPATKEQRDLLFQKMADAGYEWDSKKKELKKIESKTLDAAKVIEWLRQHSCAACCDNPDEGVSQRIDKFKTDFGLW